MVKTDKPWKGGKILAAVDIGNAELQHDTLHGSILQHGSALAELTHGELHVLYAQPSPLVSAADPSFQPEQEIQTHHRKDRQAFQARYGIADEQLHVEEGAADILTPRLTSDLHAAVTVIGTVARTGLSGALIGNTAEVVLDALESDVLVIKPEQVIEELEEMITHF
jgi:nucleotide-binding universal stress UspA family protein